ncbi:hypothetical protein H2200_009254 [Cladophialophora chaetospira]|uniref:Uncharacterized protein n=1 Tax=Cladophialophora chaetospira TaxID=386627 RepID=A0AA39CF73_9EURO|nr:hypothetical protein H2200_009254 [Cladophialophora chaetospira]
MIEEDQSLAMMTRPSRKDAIGERIQTDNHTSTPSPTPVSSSSAPARLLDLPQELQDKIYRHLYKEKYNIKAHVRDKEHSELPSDSTAPNILVLHGLPSPNLEFACRKAYQDTADLRKNAFSGHLHIPCDVATAVHTRGINTLTVLARPRFAWLRARVLEIELTGFDGKSGMSWLWPEMWDGILHGMTRLQSINVDYTLERQVYYPEDPIRTAWEWGRITQPGYDDLFAAGKKDREFTYMAVQSQVGQFADGIRNMAPNFAVYTTVRKRWLNNENLCVREQGMKFFAYLLDEDEHPFDRVQLVIVKRWQIDDPSDTIE